MIYKQIENTVFLRRLKNHLQPIENQSLEIDFPFS